MKNCHVSNIVTLVVCLTVFTTELWVVQLVGFVACGCIVYINTNREPRKNYYNAIRAALSGLIIATTSLVFLLLLPIVGFFSVVAIVLSCASCTASILMWGFILILSPKGYENPESVNLCKDSNYIRPMSYTIYALSVISYLSTFIFVSLRA